MIFCVEVLAIYENPGVVPTGARSTQRDNDLALATQRANAVGRAVVPQDDEYLRATSAKYGFGWQCRQWISVQADADTVGRAIQSVLVTRGLRDGSKVQVFPRDDTAAGYSTGAVLFQWSVPPQPTDVSRVG